MLKLIEYIEQFVKLDAEAIRALENLAKIEIYNKQQHLLENGQRCNKIWFIKKMHGKKVPFM